MEFMIAFVYVESEDVVAVDNLIKHVPFQPCFLLNVYIQALGLHRSNKVFVTRIGMVHVWASH